MATWVTDGGGQGPRWEHEDEEKDLDFGSPSKTESTGSGDGLDLGHEQGDSRPLEGLIELKERSCHHLRRGMLWKKRWWRG